MSFFKWSDKNNRPMGTNYYGDSGQDTNTIFFLKSVVWKFDIWDSSPCGF
jgi:hypothetical protein